MDANFAESNITKKMFPFYSEANGHLKMAEVLSWYYTLRLGKTSKIVESDGEEVEVRVITEEGFRTKAKTRLQVTIDIYNHNHNDRMHYVIQELLEEFRRAQFDLRNPVDELQGLIEYKPADDQGGNEQTEEDEAHLTNIWKDNLAYRKQWLEMCWQPALDKYSQGLKSRCRSAIDDMQDHRGEAKATGINYSASVCVTELLEMLDPVT